MSDQSTLSIYLKSLYKIPELAYEEEVELSAKIQAGDEKALEILVKHNLRFVVSVVKRMPAWKHSSVPVEDLVGFGNKWLLIAAKRWRPKNHARFATYAKHFILRGVNRDIQNTEKIIRLPSNVEEQLSRILYTERRLTQQLGRDPSAKEIGDSVNMTEDRVNELKSYMAREPISIHAFDSDNLMENDDE